VKSKLITAIVVLVASVLAQIIVFVTFSAVEKATPKIAEWFGGLRLIFFFPLVVGVIVGYFKVKRDFSSRIDFVDWVMIVLMAGFGVMVGIAVGLWMTCGEFAICV
jgi:hypothetical protein